MNTTRIELSVGTHRKDTAWTAKKYTWENFCRRCKEVVTGKEKYVDYLKLPKDRQDELKDVGGFVGAILSGGNRLKKAVLYRTLLTLDIDHMTAQQGGEFWDRFQLYFDCAAVIYSTRKHSPESPRYRLVIPFSRNVLAEEYPAIARKVAETLGIDQFDITTYQPERLMYWPSVCSDGLFYYRVQEGGALNPDEILQQYIGNPDQGSGWRDITQWPAGARESKEIFRHAKMVGNPLEKPGIIGSFCRAYDIHAAIDRFLKAAYVPAGDTRYTYLKGSTAGGLIVYDYEEAGAVFAFSHHGTDPASGRLCNAFDLVRLHRFGDLDHDAEAKAGTVDFGWDITKMPSYKAMIEYASLDAGVRLEIGARRLEAATQAFAGIGDTVNGRSHDGQDEQEESKEVALNNAPGPGCLTVAEIEENEGHALDNGQDWLSKLDIEKKTGVIRSTIFNVVTILENDPNLKDRFELDDFKQQEILKNKLPWRRVTKHDMWMTDRDEAALRYYLEKVYGITGVQKIRDALDTYMVRHTVHPVREYLKGLEWDGLERLDTLFIDYLGAPDNEYVREVTRKALLACVYRIMRPGVKFDNALVLVGPEGKKKSMILDNLGKGWFSDSFNTVQGKESFEQLQGWWIIEMGELSALRKSEVEAVKHFLAKRIDAYRPAFGRKTTIRPRQCVFFGTTNDMAFLKSANGNRRFWPVTVWATIPKLDVAKMSTAIIDQIWAEAMEGFRAGEKLWLDERMFEVARDVQEQHTEHDSRLPDVIEYLEREVPANWYDLGVYDRRQFLENPEGIDMKGAFKRDRICVRELWIELFKGQLKDLDKRQAGAIIELLSRAPGWFKSNNPIRIEGAGRQRGFYREGTLDR
jgi:predicted P-loop ATPase